MRYLWEFFWDFKANESLRAVRVSLTKNEDSDPKFTELAALRPLKVLRWLLGLSLMLKSLACVKGPTNEPGDEVDPMEKVVADVAAILQIIRKCSVVAAKRKSRAEE